MPLKFPTSSSRASSSTSGEGSRTPPSSTASARDADLLHVHHFLYTILTRDGRRDFMLLLPKLGDAKDIATTSGTSSARFRTSRASGGSATSRSSTTGRSTGLHHHDRVGLFLWFETDVLRFLRSTPSTWRTRCTATRRCWRPSRSSSGTSTMFTSTPTGFPGRCCGGTAGCPSMR